MHEVSLNLECNPLAQSSLKKILIDNTNSYSPRKKNFKESSLNNRFELDLNELIYGSTGYEVVYLDDNQILNLSQHEDINIVDAENILKLFKETENIEKVDDLVLTDKTFNTKNSFVELSQQNHDQHSMPLTSPVLKTSKSDLFQHPNLQSFTGKTFNTKKSKVEFSQQNHDQNSVSLTRPVLENNSDIFQHPNIQNFTDKTFNTENSFVELSQQNQVQHSMPLPRPVLETSNSDLFQHPNFQNFTEEIFNTKNSLNESSQQNRDQHSMLLTNPDLETSKSDLFQHPNLQNFSSIEGKYSKKKKSQSIINTIISLSETLRIQENDLDTFDTDSEDQILVDKKTLKRLLDLVMNSKPVQAIAKKEQLYCGFCLIKFNSSINLYKHLSNFHLNGINKEKDAERCLNKSQFFMCQICKKTFASKNVLDQHELSHLDWKNYICTLCGLRFVGAQLFLTHTKSHLNGEEINHLTCLECNVDFKTELLFESHLKNEHNWKSVMLSSTNQLQINEITSSQDANAAQNMENPEIFCSDYFIFRCNKCCKCFSNNESVVAHMNFMHKNILCKQCDIFFSYMTDYDRHMADHLIGEHFECSICKMHFPSSESLQQHFDSKHTVSKELHSMSQTITPLECKICFEKFINVQDIWIHANYHFSKKDNILSANEILGKTEIVPSEDDCVDSFKLFALSLHKSQLNNCNLFLDENQGVICVFCHNIMPLGEHKNHINKHMFLPSFSYMKPSSRELTPKKNAKVDHNKKVSSKKTLQNLNSEEISDNDEFVNNLLSKVDMTQIFNILMGEQDTEMPKSEVLNNLQNNNYLQSVSNENFTFFPDDSNRNFKSYYELLESSPEKHDIHERNFTCSNFNEEMPQDISWNMRTSLNSADYQPVSSENLQPSFRDCRNNFALSENDFHKITETLNFDLIDSSTKGNNHFGTRTEVTKNSFVSSSDIPDEQLQNVNITEPSRFDLTNTITDKVSLYDKSKVDLNLHLSDKSDISKLERIYDNSKKYKCAFCRYSSNNTQHIQEHTNSHTGERPFKCSECAINYTSKTALRRHCSRKHKNAEKKFKCDQCEYKTYQLSTLNTHKKIHLTENHLKCDKCGYTCYSKARLEQHIRSHTGLKPYKCKNCNRKYANKYYMRMHEVKCQSMKLQDINNHASLNETDISYIIDEIPSSRDEVFLSNQSLEHYLQNFDPNKNTTETNFSAENLDNTSFNKQVLDSRKVLSINELIANAEVNLPDISIDQQLNICLVSLAEKPADLKLQQTNKDDNNKDGNNNNNISNKEQSIASKRPKRKKRSILGYKKHRKVFQPGDKEKNVEKSFESLKTQEKTHLEKTLESAKVRGSARRSQTNLTSSNSSCLDENIVSNKTSLVRRSARKVQNNLDSGNPSYQMESLCINKPSKTNHNGETVLKENVATFLPSSYYNGIECLASTLSNLNSDSNAISIGSNASNKTLDKNTVANSSNKQSAIKSIPYERDLISIEEKTSNRLNKKFPSQRKSTRINNISNSNVDLRVFSGSSEKLLKTKPSFNLSEFTLRIDKIT
ncbi:uncharacterized protein LOC100199249 isoform X2 [Hydra vulgaris]|uniref:uncharacterized protein LOC100199249 isoform X2 n=1 Tax=Hydra vulgaris TaxID=6087 RepID=UPI001F5EF24D|nr:uncharacterized protein LOC100199249 isoform X3 [Hydra vulgaris]